MSNVMIVGATRGIGLEPIPRVAPTIITLDIFFLPS